MHTHETIKAYQKCSSKRWQWNEWLVFTVVASALWIIQGMLSSFHARTPLFKGESFSKETYGTKQNVGYCEIGILKCISYLYPAYFKKWFEAHQMDIFSKIFPHRFCNKMSYFFLLFFFFLVLLVKSIPLMSKRCQNFVFISSRKNINPKIHEYNFLLIV